MDWKDREKESNVEKRPIFSGRGRGRGMMAEWWRDPAHKSAFKEHEMCSSFQSIFRCLDLLLSAFHYINFDLL